MAPTYELRFEYDANDQVVAATYGDGGRCAYSYDAAGNLVSVQSTGARQAAAVSPQVAPSPPHAAPVAAPAYAAPVAVAPPPYSPPVAPAPPQPRPAPPSAATVIVSDAWILHVRSGGRAGAQLPLVATVHIGRADDCGIAIPDAKASRYHAEIAPCPGGFCIRDLQSGNGTFVNGGRITGPTPLRDGDTVLIGDTTMSVQLQTGYDPDATVINPAV